MVRRNNSLFPYRVTSNPTQILGEFASKKDAVMFAWLLAMDEHLNEPVRFYENGRLVLQWNEHEESTFENASFEPDCEVIKDGTHIATITNVDEAVFFYRDTAILKNQDQVIEIRLVADPDEAGYDAEWRASTHDDWNDGLTFYDDELLAEAERFYLSFKGEPKGR